MFSAPGITAGSSCHEKRGHHEAPGKSAKLSGTKVCPYSHPSSQNSSGTSAGNPLSTSADLCKTTPKHFKTMCRRPTPPGQEFMFDVMLKVILKHKTRCEVLVEQMTLKWHGFFHIVGVIWKPRKCTFCQIEGMRFSNNINNMQFIYCLFLIHNILKW